MSLGHSIDRVDYDQLVAEAQRRIAARSRGQWTMHGPVDPGITLLELYAWLLDQRVYRADRTPEPMVQAILGVLGEGLAPARAAGVVLELSPPGPRRLGRFAVQVARRPELTFTTRRAIAVAPVDAIELQTWEGDRTADLGRRPVPLLRADGAAAEATIVVRFAAPPPPGAPVGLGFELDDTGVEPAWSPDAVAAPPPAELTWWCNGVALTGDAVRDGTGGLRRSGVVRLTPPTGAAELRLRITTAHATFTSPPRVAAIRGNVVRATHRLRRALPTTGPWLPLPGVTLELPIDRGLPLGAVRLRLTEPDGVTRRWWAVPTLAPCGPADRVLLVERAAARLRFGDGLGGRVPRCAAGTAVAGWYEVGGGAAGDVGPTAWQPVELAAPAAVPPPGSPLAGLGVRSHVQAVGGRDREAAADARARVAALTARRTRAVTAEDHVELARTTPGVAVARAHAAIGLDPDEPCVRSPGVTTVFVVPRVGDRGVADVAAGRAITAPVADPGLLRQVEARFADTRLVGTVVHVRAARYVAIRVDVTVEADAWDLDELRARVAGALRVHLDPLHGGADGDGWPFGGVVRITALIRVAQDAAGRDGRVADVVVQPRGRDPLPACRDLELPRHALPVASVAVRLVAPRGAGGGLR